MTEGRETPKVGRVAVNALTVGARPSGWRTYMVHLLDELAPLSEGRWEIDVLAAGRRSAAMFRERLPHSNVRVVEFPAIAGRGMARMVAEQVVLPLWLRRHRVDLLFARHVMPLLVSRPTVLGLGSAHLNYEAYRQSFGRRLYDRFVLSPSARRADGFVAISEYAGRTFLDAYGVDAGRLHVTPLGYTSPVSRNGGPPVSFEGDPYALFVSTLFPHKNVGFLLRAFARFARRVPRTDLVVVGRDASGILPGLRREAESLGIADRVRFRGAIDDAELERLYREATMFVFPSLVEGFGLTVLEAMAHGVPVVASDGSSIPEVVGNAGILLPPDDEAAWAEAMAALVLDEDHHRAMAERARSRAELFTWRRTAEATLEAFESVLQRSG